jgi:hypothetical protein
VGTALGVKCLVLAVADVADYGNRLIWKIAVVLCEMPALHSTCSITRSQLVEGRARRSASSANVGLATVTA